MSYTSEPRPSSENGILTPKIYFPRVPNVADLSAFSLCVQAPPRPTVVGPIFDQELAKLPLAPFDEITHLQHYHGLRAIGERKIPPFHNDWKDPYLYPSLAKNEYLRLTTLWYFTRGLEEDTRFLFNLDQLLKTFQKAVGWEFAIAGILDEATYTRLAAVNLPLAILPRRESTCSHTILQEPGSVFMVTDMSQDWRFRLSPHVEIGGLRSYAGTQLKLSTHDGETVVLGSLCVASNDVQKPLNPEICANLVAIADVIVDQIRNRLSEMRMKERQRMTDVILSLKKETQLTILEAQMLRLVQDIYPRCKVTLQSLDAQHVTLTNRPAVSLHEFQDGIWVDTDYIMRAIMLENFARIDARQTVRAVVARCDSLDKYLVIDSDEARYTFDDFDAWFIERCASFYSERAQSDRLQEELQLKQTLLRSITHELRTPIHGILGSVDLLVEDLMSRGLLASSLTKNIHVEAENVLSAYLSAIQNSGTELITTVNNIIKTTTFSTTGDLPKVKYHTYDLGKLIDELIAMLSENTATVQLNNISLRSAGLSQRCIISTNAQILRDCIVNLLLNAMQAVSLVGGGVVQINIRVQDMQPDFEVEVLDTGVGIHPDHHERIFEPFVKLNAQKPGAGVGLTLARRLAEELGGSVSLKKSELGQGSTFCATFPLNILPPSCEEAGLPQSAPTHAVTRFFKIIKSSHQPNHMLEHISLHFLQHGYMDCKPHYQPTIMITDIAPNHDISTTHWLNSRHPVVILCYCASWSQKTIVKLDSQRVMLVVTGTLHAPRLNEILCQTARLYDELTHQSASLAEQLVMTEPLAATEANALEDIAIGPHVTSPIQSKLPEAALIPRPAEANILLVDDNPINIRVLRLFCEKRSLPCESASDGHEAVEKYKINRFSRINVTAAVPDSIAGTAVKTPGQAASGPINLIFMDLQMPKCSGIEATTAIRLLERDHNLEKSIIVMITGQDSPDDRSGSLAAGCDEFLVKPVRMNVLDELIKRYFDVKTTS